LEKRRSKQSKALWFDVLVATKKIKISWRHAMPKTARRVRLVALIHAGVCAGTAGKSDESFRAVEAFGWQAIENFGGQLVGIYQRYIAPNGSQTWVSKLRGGFLRAGFAG
jgi:hypothetical protein